MKSKKIILEFSLKLYKRLVNQIIHHSLSGEYLLLDKSIDCLYFSHKFNLVYRKLTFRDLFCSREYMALYS